MPRQRVYAPRHRLREQAILLRDLSARPRARMIYAGKKVGAFSPEALAEQEKMNQLATPGGVGRHHETGHDER